MTLARFLDAVNFPDGNPTADPSQHFADEMWFVEQKTTETHQYVEFELSSVLDLMGVQLPYRQIIKNSCPWKYRGTECGYTGPYFDKTTSKPLWPAPTTAPSVTTPVMLVATTSRMALFILADLLGRHDMSNQTLPELGSEVMQDIYRCAIQRYPNEACGFLVRTQGEKYRFMEAMNVSETPREDFVMRASDIIAAEDAGK